MHPRRDVGFLRLGAGACVTHVGAGAGYFGRGFFEGKHRLRPSSAADEEEVPLIEAHGHVPVIGHHLELLAMEQVETRQLRRPERQAYLVIDGGHLADGHDDLASVQHTLVDDEPRHLSRVTVQDETTDGANSLASAVDDARTERNEHGHLLVTRRSVSQAAPRPLLGKLTYPRHPTPARAVFLDGMLGTGRLSRGVEHALAAQNVARAAGAAGTPKHPDCSSPRRARRTSSGQILQMLATSRRRTSPRAAASRIIRPRRADDSDVSRLLGARLDLTGPGRRARRPVTSRVESDRRCVWWGAE